MACGIQNRHGKLRSAKHTFNKPFLHIFREAFIALAAPIRRATSTVDNVSERWGPFILNDINPLSSLHDAFFEKCAWKPDPASILQQGEYVSLLPSAGGLRKGLRYLRTGLLLGQLKNRRFRPSQALAMALKKEDWADPVDLSPEDPDVIRYLKGETVPSPDENGKGWRLFCTGGFPLGFVKQDGQRLKNMYLPGWRMQ